LLKDRVAPLARIQQYFFADDVVPIALAGKELGADLR
jgi:hypothetical protein